LALGEVDPNRPRGIVRRTPYSRPAGNTCRSPNRRHDDRLSTRLDNASLTDARKSHAPISASESTERVKESMRPRILAAMGRSPRDVLRKELGTVPDDDPLRKPRFPGELMCARSPIPVNRFAHAVGRSVFLLQFEIRPEQRTDHSKELHRGDTLAVGRDPLDRRGNQDNVPPEMRESPSPNHDHAPDNACV
jgi:hypothetical protein